MDVLTADVSHQDLRQPPPERTLLAPLYDSRWPLAAAVLASVLFWFELIAPPGAVAGALYPLLILFCLRAPHPRTALVAALVLTILTLLAAMVVAHPDGPAGQAVDIAGLLAITWASAAFVHRFVSLARDRVDRSLKELADTKYALDEAAIVATTDTKGIIRSVNRKFCEISKYSAEELVGQDHRIINSGYHPKTFIRDLWRTIAQGRIWTGELRNRAKDGSIYWVDTTIVPFLDRRGRPYQYMAIRHDITTRKRSEQKLREQEALARLGEMAAVVAHEVKNPLAGIKGVLQVIGSRLPEESRDRAIMGDVLARLDALNELVQDLLLFARPTEPNRRRVSPRILIESTLDLLRRDPEGAALVVHVHGPDVAVRLDPEHLGRILLNLLLNSAQAMGGQGEVTIEIRALGPRVEIRMRDTGPGMPPEVLERVFDPFYTTKHRGTGLGLPTARRLVELNDGEIDAFCPEDGGTVIVMSFPAIHEPGVPGGDAPGPAPAPGG